MRQSVYNLKWYHSLTASIAVFHHYWFSIIKHAIYRILLFRSGINEYGKQVTSSVEPNLLDCNEFRVFWIRWYSGYIAVGKGDVIGENKLMDHHPLVARDIRNVAFVTNTYAGLWKLDFVEGKYM